MQDAFSSFFTFLPALILIILFFVVYLRGRRTNRKIMDAIVEQIEKTPNFIENLSLINDTYTSRTYIVKISKPRDGERAGSDPSINLLKHVKRLRVHFSMEDRHMLFSWFFLLFKKPKDFIIIEGDPQPQKNEYLNIEIVRWSDLAKYQLEKLTEDLGDDYYDVDPESEFSNRFLHKANHPNALKYMYKNNPLIKKLIYNLPGLHRLSVRRKEDYTFRLVVKITKDFDMKLIKLLVLNLCKALSDTNQAIIKNPKRLLKAK